MNDSSSREKEKGDDVPSIKPVAVPIGAAPVTVDNRITAAHITPLFSLSHGKQRVRAWLQITLLSRRDQIHIMRSCPFAVLLTHKESNVEKHPSIEQGNIL